MKLSFKKVMPLDLFCISSLGLLVLISSLLGYGNFALMSSVFVFWLSVIYISFVKYKDLMSFRGLFLIGNIFVFFIPIIYISVFKNWYWVSYKFSAVEINETDLIKIIQVTTIGIIAFMLGYSIFNVRLGIVSNNTLIENAKKWRKILFVILVSSFFLMVARRIELFYFVLNNGFSAIYTQGVESSFIESILAYMFYVCAPICFIISKSYKEKNIIISMIVAEGVLHSLGGQRVWILFSILQVLYLINYKLCPNEKIRIQSRVKLIAKLFMIAVIMIYLMGYILHVREDVEFDIFNFSILDYFIGQFGTIVGLKLVLTNYDFAFSSNIPPILDTININRQSVQSIVDETVSNLGSRVTYLACSTCFYDGRSYGNSIYMQLYQLGLWGVFLGTFVIGLFCRFLDLNKKDSMPIFIIGFFMCKHILWMPRGEYFPHYINIVLIISTCLLTFFIQRKIRF
ncbi:O-antigen polysaccharide polymerase Wzy [Vibrio cholerae]|nr:O-antigen polysaccharide polymerase Wzy [Vibrio cholerae]